MKREAAERQRQEKEKEAKRKKEESSTRARKEVPRRSTEGGSSGGESQGPRSPAQARCRSGKRCSPVAEPSRHTTTAHDRPDKPHDHGIGRIAKRADGAALRRTRGAQPLASVQGVQVWTGKNLNPKGSFSLVYRIEEGGHPGQHGRALKRLFTVLCHLRLPKRLKRPLGAVPRIGAGSMLPTSTRTQATKLAMSVWRALGPREATMTCYQT